MSVNLHNISILFMFCPFENMRTFWLPITDCLYTQRRTREWAEVQNCNRKKAGKPEGSDESEGLETCGTTTSRLLYGHFCTKFDYGSNASITFAITIWNMIVLRGRTGSASGTFQNTTCRNQGFPKFPSMLDTGNNEFNACLHGTNTMKALTDLQKRKAQAVTAMFEQKFPTPPVFASLRVQSAFPVTCSDLSLCPPTTPWNNWFVCVSCPL